MTFDETVESFADEWILMLVTDFDEDHIPARGRVLAHSRSRTQISKVLARQPRPSQVPVEAGNGPYYIFVAYPRIRSGEELRQVLERAAADPSLEAHLRR